MKYDLARPDARLSAVLLSPLERMEWTTLPTWGKILAGIGALAQLLIADAFVGALLLVIVIGMADYIVGVKAARMANDYDPQAAHRGAMGKMSGILILLLIRAVEGWVSFQGLGNTKGAAATAVAISLFAVDLQSIAHHRESFGAKPIPVLGRLLEWIQDFANSRLPDPAGTPRRRASDVQPLDDPK